MSDLKIFNHPKFGGIEILDIKGNPWFGATKAAVALGYSNPRKAIIDHCKAKGVTIRDSLTDGGKQAIKFIDEGNLYRLIVRSKLPEAERFESWVFDEVLPQIRKTGSYSVQPKSQAELLVMYANHFLEMEQRVNRVEESVDTIKQTIIDRDEDWRSWVKKAFNSAVMHSTEKDFQSIRSESYELLERRGHCDLKARLRNLRNRLEDEGATKSKINSVNRMDVIEADPRLKEIYTSIVKELSIRLMPVVN